MAAEKVFNYTLGERIWLKLGVTPAGTSEIDYSQDQVTVNIDSESTGQRHTFYWNPLGTASDAEFELSDNELYFSLTSAWTADPENMHEGRWVMSVSAFDPETDQDEAGAIILNMGRRPGGPLPVVGV